MKTEDRILELLAEYLKKTDQTIERMDGANKRMDDANKRMDAGNKRMDLAYDVLIKHSEELIELRKVSEKNQQEIIELRNESINLRNESLDLRKVSIKHEIQQDVLLKEILSISRRVGNLEDNR